MKKIISVSIITASCLFANQIADNILIKKNWSLLGAKWDINSDNNYNFVSPIKNIFVYQNGWKNFKEKPEINRGYGYWVQSDWTTTIEVPIDAEKVNAYPNCFTYDIKKGWNLLGSITTLRMNENDFSSQNVNSIWIYDTKKQKPKWKLYIPNQTNGIEKIDEGIGFWLNAKDDFKLQYCFNDEKNSTIEVIPANSSQPIDEYHLKISTVAPILNAKVVDAEGTLANAIDVNGTYSFKVKPKPPISITGGFFNIC